MINFFDSIGSLSFGRRSGREYAEAVMNLTTSKTPYSDLLASYVMGDTTKDLLEAFPNKTQDVVDFKAYLEENNLSIKQAVAIYQYSVNSNEILAIMRNQKTSEELIEKAYKRLLVTFSKIYPQKDAVLYANVALEFAKAYDYNGKGETIVSKDFVAMAKENGISILPVMEYSREMTRIACVKENIRLLTEILQNHELKESLVLYRGVNSSFLSDKIKGDWKNLVNQAVPNKFPTSTSKYMDKCMGKGSRYDLIFEINIPAGTKGIDISAMSSFGDAEAEVLLADNEFKITSIESTILNGMPKMLAHCEINQKGFERTVDNSDLKQRDYFEGVEDLTETLDEDR